MPVDCYAINDGNDIIDCMASITIRKLKETTKRKLKIRAAMHGRSMEQEAREILKSALAKAPKRQGNLAERIRAIWEPLGGVELELYPDEPIRDPDWLKDWN
jgi:plasmid stability protein